MNAMFANGMPKNYTSNGLLSRISQISTDHVFVPQIVKYGGNGKSAKLLHFNQTKPVILQHGME